MKVWLDYTNYAGVRSVREVLPANIEWGSNQWHPNPGWLMEAFDYEKRAHRTFSLEHVHQFSNLPIDPDAILYTLRASQRALIANTLSDVLQIADAGSRRIEHAQDACERIETHVKSIQGWLP